jgi:hypothetical protein
VLTDDDLGSLARPDPAGIPGWVADKIIAVVEGRVERETGPDCGTRFVESPKLRQGGGQVKMCFGIDVGRGTKGRI